MLDRQFADSSTTCAVSRSSLLSLWIFPNNAPLLPVTRDEEKVASGFSCLRSRQFLHSRGYVRHALSCLWNVPPLDIPLQAHPSSPPELANGWGYISFSHCSDALLVGWSPWQLGVDLERSDRSFAAANLARRFFDEELQEVIKSLDSQALRLAVLEQWLVKEAAVKWQKGTLAEDLRHWRFDLGSSSACHDLLHHRIGIHRAHFRDWEMAVACELKLISNPLILCSV